MQGRRMLLAVGAIVALAGLLATTQTTATPIARYRLVDLGPSGAANSIGIDQDGNTGLFAWQPTAPYSLLRNTAPGEPWRTLSYSLRREGSDPDLMPEAVNTPDKANSVNVSSAGLLVGNYGRAYGWVGAFAYDAETGRTRDLARLPGTDGSLLVYGVNRLSQIVGEQGSRAILYDGPDSVPSKLIDVTVGAEGWNLLTATGINDRGEIVGYADRSGVGSRFYKLEPLSVPEPASVAMFAALALAATYLGATRGRLALRSTGLARVL